MLARSGLIVWPCPVTLSLTRICPCFIFSSRRRHPRCLSDWSSYVCSSDLLRGNVDTRMRKLEEGEYDAIILAAAGLTRLGKTELVKEVLSEEFMCPAAGQGALGIEIREGDVEMREHLSFLDDSSAHAATTCERALLNKLGGGCQVPIGAFAEMKDGKLQLTAIVARPDGTEVLREQQSGSDPITLGEKVGDTLLRRGATRILEDVYGAAAAAPQQPGSE